jgi:hypothetical protein
MADVLARAGLLPTPGQPSAAMASMDEEQRRVLQFLLRPLVAMHDIRYPETRDPRLLQQQANERSATMILKSFFEQIAPGVTAMRDPLLRVGVRYMAHHGGQPPSLYTNNAVYTNAMNNAMAQGFMQQPLPPPPMAVAAVAVAAPSPVSSSLTTGPRRISHGMYAAPTDIPPATDNQGQWLP